MNSKVGDISAADPDASDKGRLTLVLSSNPDDIFLLKDNELLVKTPAAMDRIKNPSLTIQVTAKDPGGLSFSKSFVISVLDANDPPTDLALSVEHFNENVAIGTVVATISSQDKDEGQKHSYEVVNPKDTFGMTGGSHLTIKRKVDFEKEASVGVEIKVTDDGSPPLSAARNFTLKVSCLNTHALA